MSAGRLGLHSGHVQRRRKNRARPSETGSVLMAAPLEAFEVACKHILRRWRIHPTDLRHAVTRVARSCDRDGTVAVGKEDMKAIAWLLLAMYWRGSSHPGSLFMSALHPPTGLLRWMINTQREPDAGNTVEGAMSLLVQALKICHRRATALARVLLKRAASSGRVRLAPQLLADDHWSRGWIAAQSHLYYVTRQRNQRLTPARTF